MTKTTTFTWIGWALVIILLIVFIRTRTVTWLLGTILLGLFLMNYNKVAPILFNNPTPLSNTNATLVKSQRAQAF